MNSPSPQDPQDPLMALKQWTSARIALGRTGGSLLTHPLLDFRKAHAVAIDAVYETFDPQSLCQELEKSFPTLTTLQVNSAASDRETYLLRPDLGRTLSPSSQLALEKYSENKKGELAIILSDGLSANAVNRHAVPLLTHLLPMLLPDWRLTPLIVVPYSRVALQDEIGKALGASYALILLGERPGLMASDNLSAYLVRDPQPGNTDAQRNCVSNIRPDGLDLKAAAEKIAYLLNQSRETGMSGYLLKDESEPSVTMHKIQTAVEAMDYTEREYGISGSEMEKIEKKLTQVSRKEIKLSKSKKFLF